MPRLFTALEIPRDAALSLSFLAGGLPSARWIDPENYHLTLRFIGDVDSRTADELVAVLDRIRQPAFQLELRGVDAFGSKKPHSVYAGVNANGALDMLQADIDKACRRVGLPPDTRRFTPHVTLARLRHAKGEEVARYLSASGGFRTAPFAVTRFVLFSAKDSVGGGPYVREEVFPLQPVSGREVETQDFAISF
ncbi:RNA 2',3'-cyclic phosphodiesterase [Aureimonas fodinaquatilis]|uniref:RNA 2',3'-cyclic phosphodiesterase n=1 Tax=Aureimonas fodinaquatilis TaxID=2565783 RepID=A0A5B0DWX5_9HYPH|nr:RNA 2',3'-cyclic phosphodiesterase [Aureimonas fodinaquatilis]KAA0969709.1 RNA 2',3'-cyclic phosphodiesterase [Aureimonas fodinaquatilis]